MKKGKKLNHRILAEGEATGHMHTACDGVLFETDSPDVKILSTKSSTKIDHQEHAPITVPAGDFEVHRVQEYDHFEEEAKQVAD